MWREYRYVSDKGPNGFSAERELSYEDKDCGGVHSVYDTKTGRRGHHLGWEQRGGQLVSWSAGGGLGMVH